MTTFPTVTTRLALDSNPNETPSWVDVSAYHRGIYCRRGRQHELNRVEAGIARVRLDNRDRRFEPEYPGDLVNLCTNPSIEVNTTGWSVASNGDGAIARASSPEKYGGFSLAMGASTGTETDARYNYTFLPNTQYTVSAWLYITTTGGGTPTLHVSDGVDTYSANFNAGITGAWQRVSVTFTTGAGPLGTAGAGTSYIDAPRCAYALTGDILIYTDGVQIETGTLTDYVDGDQTDCRWEGTAHASQSYRGGPYYPYILSERRLNHRVTWLGVTYDLFTGFIEDWPVRWPHKGMDAIVEVPAYDGLAVLAIPEVRASLPEEKTGARVNRLLNGANWTTGGAWVLNSSVNSVLNSTTRLGPVGDRLVSDGESTMQALDLTDQETKALEHLRTVEETENGLVFVNGAGQLVFHSRHRRLRYPYTVSQATFGDNGGSEIPYADLEPEYTVHEVRNDVHVKVTGGDTYDATDATSKGKYHKRSYSRELALAGSAAHEAQSAANWILNRYKDQHIRFRRIVVKLASVPQSLWPTLLGLEIGDRVTAIRRQDSNGDAMEQDCHVEAIEHDIPPELADWTITYDVSPANPNSYWRLGDGALATSTRLAY